MATKKEPKYCNVCGAELVASTVDTDFDIYTGKKTSVRFLECPARKDGKNWHFIKNMGFVK